MKNLSCTQGKVNGNADALKFNCNSPPFLIKVKKRAENSNKNDNVFIK